MIIVLFILYNGHYSLLIISTHFCYMFCRSKLNQDEHLPIISQLNCILIVVVMYGSIDCKWN